MILKKRANHVTTFLAIAIVSLLSLPVVGQAQSKNQDSEKQDQVKMKYAIAILSLIHI